MGLHPSTDRGPRSIRHFVLNMASHTVAFAAGVAAGVGTFLYFKKIKNCSFLAKVGAASTALGANVISPEAASALLESTPDALLLDVQDPGSDMIKGSHSASLGTLPFKASTDLPDFKDPLIADRPKDGLVRATGPQTRNEC